MVFPRQHDGGAARHQGRHRGRPAHRQEGTMRRALVSISFAITAVTALVAVAGCASAPSHPTDARYDLVIRGGVVYDGSGGPPRRVDVAIRGDRIVALLP